MPNEDVALSNIVIFYSNLDEVVKYTKSLSNQNDGNKIHLAIVLNKSTEKETEELKHQLMETDIKYSIFNPGCNIGYLNGMIYGYKQLKKKGINTDWVICSNTDIEYANDGFISDLLNSDLLGQKDIWQIGPSVYAVNREEFTSPFKYARSQKWDIKKTNIGMTFPHMFTFLHGLKQKMQKKNGGVQPKSCEVYAIHGSYMILRKELLDIVEKREPWELLYNEETYLGELVYLNNKITYYFSDILVYHTEGTSTGKVNMIPKYKMMKRANSRILKEFY